MSYNPEKPQFWQPFSLPGVRSFMLNGGHKWEPTVGLLGTLRGQDARHVVYPEYSEDAPLHELLGNDGFVITSHIGELMRRYPDLQVKILFDAQGQPVTTGESYRHSFVWRDGDSVMLDSWVSHVGVDDYPQCFLRVFRDDEEVDPREYGHAGGNTLIVMGEEEKYRRKLAKLGKGISDFAYRSTDNMPEFEPGFIAYTRRKRR